MKQSTDYSQKVSVTILQQTISYREDEWINFGIYSHQGFSVS